MTPEKSKILTIAVVGLLVLNFCTLAFIWMGRDGSRGRPTGRPNTAEFLIRELSFNENQISLYDKLKKEHHTKVEDIRKEIHDLHDAYFNLIKTNAPDSLKVKDFARQISDKQEAIELITFYHFSDVRKICDPGQQKKFDQVIDEALRMMAPQPPGRPHP